MREKLIKKLKDISPMITQVTETLDMGFEFSAITTQGVIYAEPGMLLSFSKGHWPFNGKEAKEMNDASVQEFLLDETWNVIPWEDLSDEELQEWLEAAQ